jgi:uncharacterized iron-regulated membrane protein
VDAPLAAPVGGWADLVRRALAGHAALGLLAAALLYVIALTGTLAVIDERWQRWERPAVPEFTVLSPTAAQAATIAAFGPGHAPRPARLAIQLPTDDLPRAILTTDAGSWYLDRAGREAGRPSPGWAGFVVGLHETLLLPATWGYALVGALGVALASLALTGVLAHPRIVRDAFRLRWRQGPAIARVDWHNRLGIWTLPFTLAVALTGSVLGLGTVGFAVLADAYHGGSLEQAYAPLFGRAPAADARPGPVPDVGAALLALHAGVPWARPATVTVQAPGMRGQEIAILTIHPRRLIYGETYRFDALGRPLGKVGLSDGTLGQQAVASVYRLHFGSYGGLPMQLAYLLFGTALCVVIATGPSIWLHKRRRRGLGGPRLPACWNAIVWGSPLLLTLSAWLWFVGGKADWLGSVFWLGLAAIVAAAAARPALFGAARCRGVVLAAMAVTGLAHLLFVPAAAIGSQMIDAMLCLGAGIASWIMRNRRDSVVQAR